MMPLTYPDRTKTWHPRLSLSRKRPDTIRPAAHSKSGRLNGRFAHGLMRLGKPTSHFTCPIATDKIRQGELNGITRKA